MRKRHLLALRLGRAFIVVSLAAPASAQRLGAFESQFIRKAGASETVKSVEPAQPKVGGPGTRAEAVEHDEPQGFLGHLLQPFGEAIIRIPLLPYGFAMEQPRRERGEHRLNTHVHHIEDRIRGWGGSYRFSAPDHVAFEAHWTAYLEEGAQYDLHYTGARAVAEFAAGGGWTWDYGLGVSGLIGRLGRGGPDISLGAQFRPVDRLFLDGRAGIVVMEGGNLGDLRGGAGVRWGRAELHAGYRALVGPFNTLGGPEIGVTVRL